MRHLRFIPEEGALVEVTCRTLQSRYLLRPGPVLDDIILGILGRAQRLYSVTICGFSFLSNHFHLVIQVPDAERMARFMCYFSSNLARELKRLADWPEKIWSRRYQAIVISDEPAAQIDRLRYVLAQGIKEGLVAKVGDWPGLNMVKALLEDKPLKGMWFDRTKEYAARLKRRSDFDPKSCTSEETVVLSPLPCLRELSPQAYRELVVDLVREIEAEAAAEMALTGRGPLGPKAILRQHPHTRPNRTKKSPATLFHAATKAVRLALREAYGRFLAAFREAAERLKAGDRFARFPNGCFPPGLPFVRI